MFFGRGCFFFFCFFFDVGVFLFFDVGVFLFFDEGVLLFFFTRVFSCLCRMCFFFERVFLK